jgi:hypothetical protein
MITQAKSRLHDKYIIKTSQYSTGVAPHVGLHRK